MAGVTGDGREDLEALLRAANRGDGVAYGRFLQAITPILRGIVRVRGAALGPHGCEDVLQEVLLAIHLKRQTWREDAALRPWLYAIARHKVVDAFRQRGQRVELSVDDWDAVLPAAEDPDPLEQRDLERVLARLDPRAAEILRSIGLAGASAAETAARLQMTEGAVRVALHRALKSLATLREVMIE
jgi:RNA polymerase sigma-70 factor (ECF subfamily)